MIKTINKDLKKKLLVWFTKNKRELPWRKTKDPYKIWISEVMLQQTTSTAVIPYYNRFIKKFPNISSLAKADKKDLFPVWAGLGYYKRAENLISAAKKLKKKKNFPKTHEELLKLPGFGSYTSRAVSSLAFEESVGVLDGNVIRFLSRFHALSLKHWKTKERAKLQKISNLWIKNEKPSQMNQALMEIGSLICRSKNPLCLICPVMNNCQAHKKSLKESLPLKQNKKSIEFWHWTPKKIKKNSRWAFIKNTELPFLKRQFIFPGKAKKIKTKIKNYDFIHSITHYKIFITVQNSSKPEQSSLKWFTKSQIEQINPSSLIKKILNYN